VTHVSCDECPVSYIKPEFVSLVKIITRARHIHDISGASLFGPDAGKWLAWQVDAVETIEIERKLLSRSES